MKIRTLSLLAASLLLLGTDAALALPGPHLPGPRHAPTPGYLPHAPAPPDYYRPHRGSRHYNPYRAPRGPYRPGPRVPHPPRP